MNATLVKALVALVPVSVLVGWSGVTFTRRETPFSLLQLVGAGCLVVVVLTHVCEALHLLPGMHWGEPDSPGHYLDLSRGPRTDSDASGIHPSSAGTAVYRASALKAVRVANRRQPH